VVLWLVSSSPDRAICVRALIWHTVLYSWAIDLFTNTAAILDSIVSDTYYGMLRGQIHTNLPPEHPIITI